MTLQEFARHEYVYAPLTELMHTRFPKPLSVFIKTVALTEGVGESTVVRYACRQWAASQGFSATCV
jgi:hypothetical protein